MKLTKIKELANLAYSTDENDEGSSRQLGAEYTFFAAVENLLSKERVQQEGETLTRHTCKERIDHFVEMVELFFNNESTPAITMLPVTPHEMIILDRVLKDHYDYLTTQDDYGSHEEDIEPTASLLTKIDCDETLEDHLLSLRSISVKSARRIGSVPIAFQLGGIDLGVGDTENGVPVYFAWHKNLDREDALKLIQKDSSILLIYDIDRDLYSTKVDALVAKKYLPVE